MSVTDKHAPSRAGATSSEPIDDRHTWREREGVSDIPEQRGRECEKHLKREREGEREEGGARERARERAGERGEAGAVGGANPVGATRDSVGIPRASVRVDYPASARERPNHLRTCQSLLLRLLPLLKLPPLFRLPPGGSLLVRPPLLRAATVAMRDHPRRTAL